MSTYLNDESFEDSLGGIPSPKWRQQCYDGNDHKDEPNIVIKNTY